MTQNLESSLLDDDGSCRDVNFESPTWDGLAEVLALLGRTYRGGSATRLDGSEMSEPFPKLLDGLLQGGHAVLRDGPPPVSHLQVFVSVENDGSPFVELSFFPEDVARVPSLMQHFIEWVDGIRSGLRAKRSFVRYENHSWRLGDVSAASGVFLVSDGK